MLTWTNLPACLVVSISRNGTRQTDMMLQKENAMIFMTFQSFISKNIVGKETKFLQNLKF